MLLADVNIGESPAAIITVGGMVLAAISGLAASLFSYLSARAKLKYDVEMTSLKAKIEAVEQNHEECEAAHNLTRQELSEVKKRCEAAERLAAKMQGEQDGTAHELSELRKDVDKLRTMLYQKTGH